MTDHPGLWIRTEPTIDGAGYIVVVEADADHAFTLNPRAALQYAAAVTAAASRAEYDAAISAQLTAAGGTRKDVAATILDIREDRPDLVFPPELTFVPGVNPAGKAFIRIDIAGKAAGQVSPAAARSHALGILEALQVAQLDATYLEHLTTKVRLDERSARHVVAELINHRGQHHG